VVRRRVQGEGAFWLKGFARLCQSRPPCPTTHIRSFRRYYSSEHTRSITPSSVHECTCTVSYHMYRIIKRNETSEIVYGKKPSASTAQMRAWSA
jgi:hypothetical protein